MAFASWLVRRRATPASGSPVPRPASRRRSRRLASDESGVAIIEAAFIFPLMVVILGMLVVWGQAYDIKRKVVQTTRTVTDLVSQYSDMNTSDYLTQAMVDTDLDYAADTMLPYSYNNTALISVVVSELQANSTATQGTVMWSEAQYAGTPLVQGSTVTLPAGIVANNGYILYGQASYTYTPLQIGANPVGTMQLADTFFIAPRAHTCIPYQSPTYTTPSSCF
jgi:Flp pilus assembly protein TadG